MTVEDVWAQLEAELLWRQEELRLLSNTIVKLPKENDRDLARRSQLVMLYAHTEGFCKVALSIYVKAINDVGLRCRDAQRALVASAFGDVFHAIAYGDRKGKVFKEPLPDDEGLYVFCRQRDFISSIEDLLLRPLTIPDEVVNTEYNLSSKVLRRNLFRLGFAADLVTGYESNLNELARRRHGIAHGIEVSPIPSDVYERLQKAAFNVMDELALLIVDTVERSGFVRNSVSAA